MNQLCELIAQHAIEIENILFAAAQRDYSFDSNVSSALKNLLECEFDARFLNKDSGSSTIEAKAYAFCLTQLGLCIIDGKFSSPLKYAMLKYLNVVGHLFDRGPENYYISTDLLNAFLNKLQTFIDSLPPSDRIQWQFFIDRIPQCRGFLEGAALSVSEERKLELDSIRQADVSQWLEQCK
jgi:hypothetical protein